jgi:hypothetical protein
VSQPCASTCCRKPDAPNVRLVVEPDVVCSDLELSEFDAERPFEGDEGPVNGLVASPTAAARKSTLGLSPEALPSLAVTRRLAGVSSLRGR